MKPENAIPGFSGSGLYPIDLMKLTPRIAQVSLHPDISTSDNSPRKMLLQAIINAVMPPPTEETRAAMANSKRKRKRVQDKAGEVQMAEDVIERLRQEEIQRNAKKALKGKSKKSFVIAASSKSQAPKKRRENSRQQKSKNNRRALVFDDSSSSDSDDLSDSVESKDEDSVPCLVCGKLYGQESMKFRPHWVSCDTCEKWTCVECLPNDFNIDDNFLCTSCLI
eukprot:gene10565-11686_t